MKARCRHGNRKERLKKEMEIELKYRLPKEVDIDAIFSDPDIEAIKDADSEESLDMQAVYFDTEDIRLSRDGIAYRVRREGNRIIGTLKWNGSSDEGMHVREEINVPIDDESKLTEPDISIFSESDIYDTLCRAVGDRKLKKMMTIEFTRRRARLDNGRAICELSADLGSVFADDKEAPISEMEIELYSGSREAMEELGAEIATKFGLVPENRSKFRQGLELSQNGNYL